MFDLGLEEKIVLITGGSDGLGRATAERFAEEGANVLICGRRKEHVEEVAAQINTSKSTTGKVMGVKADVTKSEDCEKLINEGVEIFGAIDVLVNNAGASAAFGIEALDDDVWINDFNLKVLAAVRLSRLAIPYMKQRGGGSIINASISGGKAPRGGALPTTVMRSAGLNLTKSLSQEFAASKIRVNAVCIGLIKSMQWVRRAGNGTPEKLYDEFSKQIPLGRVGEASEYADLVAFLCSKRASYITGTAINLDGGLCPVL